LNVLSDFHAPLSRPLESFVVVSMMYKLPIRLSSSATLWYDPALKRHATNDDEEEKEEEYRRCVPVSPCRVEQLSICNSNEQDGSGGGGRREQQPRAPALVAARIMDGAWRTIFGPRARDQAVFRAAAVGSEKRGAFRAGML
jgi:hypothetical protein